MTEKENPTIRPTATVFCPKCNEESFIVLIADSGQCASEYGTNHWFSGDGECTECHHKSFYTDSSH